MSCKDGQFDIVGLFKHFSIDFAKNQPEKSQARGNRKTLKWPKMTTKSNFRTSKLKSHEEYLIYRTYFMK